MWFRRHSLTEGFSLNREEMWTDSSGRNYPIMVEYGKKTNLFGLKENRLTGFEKRVRKFRRLCRDYISNPKLLEVVERCGLCGLSSSHAIADTTIQGITYYRCPRCEFRFIKKQFSKEASEEFYSHNTFLSSTYTDKRLTEKRVKDIVMPKVSWTVNQFRKIFGRNPRRILDVGAGGGHFVHAAKKMGLKADGLESNKPSIKYCKEVFNIDLKPIDFLKYKNQEAGGGPDIITFWTVLEHLPNFMDFLKMARKILKKDALIVAEVPRWSSFDTALQKLFPSSVTRHIVPPIHSQIFSDSALANAFIKSGFIPRSAWYFGMDMYELTMQIARAAKSDSLIKSTGEKLLSLQPVIDQGMLSDTMVFAGIPNKKPGKIPG